MDKEKETKVTWGVYDGLKFGFGFGAGIFLFGAVISIIAWIVFMVLAKSITLPF